MSSDPNEIMERARQQYGWGSGEELENFSAFSNLDKTIQSEIDNPAKKVLATEALVQAVENPAGAAASVAANAMAHVKEYVMEEAKSIEEKRRQEQEEHKKNSVMRKIFPLTTGVLVLFLAVFLVFASSQESEGANSIVEAAEKELEMSDYNIGGDKYKKWYGVDGNWCAMFVSYCADQCGYIEDGTMPKSCAVREMAAWYRKKGQFKLKGNYYPQPGDIVFFQNGMSHVGIVISYDAKSKKITTIEGNTGSSSTNPYHKGSRVKKKTYPLTYAKISGFGHPEYSKFIVAEVKSVTQE